MREMHSAVTGGMSDDAVLNDFRYRERHTDRRHSPAAVDAVRSRARSTQIGTDRRSTTPARREPDRLSVRCQATDSSRDEYFERHRCRRKAERSGSADAERGADASTDSTERSGCGDHHGRPPFGLELSESSPAAFQRFATSEHYRHRNSQRNPFLGIVRDCIPEQGRHGAGFVVSRRSARWVPSSCRSPSGRSRTRWRGVHRAPTAGVRRCARPAPGLQAARCDVGGPVAVCVLGAGQQARTVRSTSHRVAEHAPCAGHPTRAAPAPHAHRTRTR